MTGQLSYAAALAHQDCVFKVGEECRVRKVSWSAAVAYDEVCRKKWAERVALQVPDFDVEKEARRVDKDLPRASNSMLGGVGNCNGPTRLGPTSPLGIVMPYHGRGSQRGDSPYHGSQHARVSCHTTALSSQ